MGIPRFAFALALLLCLVPASASARLPGGVKPARYLISLGIDLDAGTFQGSETIEVELAAPSATITLHSQELEIVEARAGAATDKTLAVGKVAVLPAKARPGEPADSPDTLSVTVPRPIAAGKARLAFTFRGKLDEHLRGLYLARHDGKRYAMTQFEGVEARRAFPCFDEPALKARFQLTLTVPRGQVAVSNTPIVSRVAAADGRTDVVTFAETLPMSTYLVAMGVGPLVSKSIMAGKTPITVYGPPGHEHLFDYALKESALILPRLEAWFGIPYPYGKLDLIAAPEFQYGGMENVGCILFRMSALLVDDKVASPGARRRVTEVIAHEIAHQWFGDLVTMAWWDDIWLNESFATWMEKKVVDEVHPEWGVWRDFLVERDHVLEADELGSTHAIRSRMFSDQDEDDNETSPTIIYGKGSAVLRMIERWLGEDRFRAGVRAYLEKHKFGNTKGSDFFEALGEASGQPVGTMAAQWVEQVGHPLVSVSASCTAGKTRLTFEQERLFGDGRGHDETLWQVPVCTRFPAAAGDDKGREICVMLKDRRQSIDLGLDAGGCLPWVVANAGAAGFFRVRYDDALRAALIKGAPKLLGTEERLALLGDQWALVAAGRAPIAGWFEVVAALRGEGERVVLQPVFNELMELDRHVLTDRDRPALARLVEALFGPRLASLGLVPPTGKDEPEEVRRLRALAFTGVGRLGRRPDVIARSRQAVGDWLHKDVPLDGALADAEVQVAAQAGDAALYDLYLKRFAEDRSPEERDRLLGAFSQFEHKELIDRTLQLSLGTTLAKEEFDRPVQHLLGTRLGAPEALRFLEANLPALQKRGSQWSVISLTYSAGKLCGEGDAARVKALFEAHPAPHGRLALALALDQIGVCNARRQQAGSDLAALLDAASGAAKAAARTGAAKEKPPAKAKAKAN